MVHNDKYKFVAIVKKIDKINPITKKLSLYK